MQTLCVHRCGGGKVGGALSVVRGECGGFDVLVVVCVGVGVCARARFFDVCVFVYVCVCVCV